VRYWDEQALRLRGGSPRGLLGAFGLVGGFPFPGLLSREVTPAVGLLGAAGGGDQDQGGQNGEHSGEQRRPRGPSA
jgi:hypothetical protein